MSYEFEHWEEELEPQTASARIGGPPRKSVRIGVIDPPRPPKRPPGPLAAPLASFFARVFAAIILVGLVLFTLFLLLG
jgi:hypothetical protein